MRNVWWAAIAAVFINVGIHLTMTPNHLAEKRYIGILFVIGSVLLGAVMIGLASDRDRLRAPAWAGGSLVCSVEFLLFLLSRTTGLPQGYHEARAAAPEDLLGLTSLFVELVFLGCAVASLTTTPRNIDTNIDTRTSRMPLHDRTASLT